MKAAGLCLALVLFGVTAASASSTHTLRGQGVRLSLPAGWDGLVGPGGVQAADFPLSRRSQDSANLVRVRRGHVHLIIWNGGPWVPYLRFAPSRPPLALAKRNLTGAMEGFGTSDMYAIRSARLGGEMLEVLADLGPKPFAPSSIRKVNVVLRTLRALPPRVVRPRDGRLAADGVSVHLLPGWSGRMEIPAGRYGARLVLRAAHAGVHVDLLEYAENYGSGRARTLPVALTRSDVLRRSSVPLARAVFSNGGRSFDVVATARSSRDLREANRFLATLAVAARPWTFRCCDLALGLPGTWRAGLTPRLYPVIKLHGPGVLVALTELRPGERAHGRILRRAGRRFQVEVRPASARRRADAVLATLRVKPRS